MDLKQNFIRKNKKEEQEYIELESISDIEQEIEEKDKYIKQLEVCCTIEEHSGDAADFEKNNTIKRF